MYKMIVRTYDSVDNMASVYGYTVSDEEDYHMNVDSLASLEPQELFVVLFHDEGTAAFAARSLLSVQFNAVTDAD